MEWNATGGGGLVKGWVSKAQQKKKTDLTEVLRTLGAPDTSDIEEPVKPHSPFRGVNKVSTNYAKHFNYVQPNKTLRVAVGNAHIKTREGNGTLHSEWSQ